jgi:DNA-binding Lrp family transcriptional regulator
LPQRAYLASLGYEPAAERRYPDPCGITSDKPAVVEPNGMTYRLDEIDRRIIHALLSDARNTTATSIAEGLNVSGETVRNRIGRLEEAGVIQGYTATVDFERAGGRLTSVYMCTVPAAERERLALAARSIPGVINVRVLMAGRRDLQVVAVGEDTEDLRTTARSLSELDIRIEDEELVQTEIRSPYAPFAPDEDPQRSKPTDLVTLPDGTDVVEVAVSPGAPIVEESVVNAKNRGLLPEDAVLVSIERDGELIQPTGDTVVEADDVVTLLPRDDHRDEVLAAFLDGERAD